MRILRQKRRSNLDEKASSIVAREVLLISNQPSHGHVLSEMLGSLSISIEQVTGLKDARRKVQHGAFVVVLTEANLPDGTWHEVLDLVGELDCKVIVTDPHADARLWVEALNRGVYDFIAQPFAATEVQRIVGNACSRDSITSKRVRAV
jgi:DNA-binding NtrC family response regulator